MKRLTPTCPQRPLPSPAAERGAARAKGGGWLFPLLLVAASLAALPASAQSAPKGEGLVVSKAWIRFIMAARPAAGYFTLSNETDRPRKLTGASSPACGDIMLHRSLRENGVEKMDMVDSVVAPAHGVISFSPGSYHLMCMSPSATMKAGAHAQVTLDFADGAHVQADFVVKGASATGE